MRKTLTMLLSLLLSVALSFAFVACNPAKDDGKDEGDGPQEPVDNSVANSQIIESAFGALLDSEALHLSLEDVSFSLEKSEMLGFGETGLEIAGDLYVRKTESGYDLVGKLNLMVSAEETTESAESSVETYQSNEFLALEIYYVDEQICTLTNSFSQVIIDGAAYDSFSDYQADPEDKDDYIYTGVIDDFSAVDEKIGNDVTVNESRVSTDLQYRPANSLDDILTRLAEDVPVLEQLGFNSLEDYVSLLKRAGASVAKLDGGKTTPAEDGGKELSVKLDLVSLYNSVASFVTANMDSTIGAALDNLAGQGEKYVEKVIDRLFPATGSSLTVKQFIAALEETLGELGVDFSFKALVDEIQTITGLTTQEIADVINPLLQGFYTLTPEEGDTLYDAVINAVGGLQIDALLKLIPTGSGSSDGTEGGTEGTGSESTEEPLTSAMINKMVKEYAYNPEITLSVLFETMEMPILEVLGMIDVQKGEISFDFAFDAENKLTELSASGSLGIYMTMPAGEEGAEAMKEPFLIADVSATLAVEYAADDSVFALPIDVETTPCDYDEAVTVGTSIKVRDLLVAAGCMTEEEAAAVDINSDSVGFYGIEADGYISSENSVYYLNWDYSQDEYYVYAASVSSDYESILAICTLDEGVYMVKLRLPVQSQA